MLKMKVVKIKIKGCLGLKRLEGLDQDVSCDCLWVGGEAIGWSALMPPLSVMSVNFFYEQQ